MNPEDILQPASPELPEAPAPMETPEPNTHVPNTLPVTEPGERTIFTIKRHPIGVLGVYVMCGLVLIVTTILAFILAPSIFSGNGDGSNTGQVMLASTLVFTIVATICVGFALIVTKVYWGNSWTLTTDSITQVSQSSLLSRQSSQLELGDMEDVTAEQNGMLPQMFNYGVLKVETAGHSSNFIFPFCPNPNYYARQILAARETYEQNRRTGESVYQPAPQIPQPPQRP